MKKLNLPEVIRTFREVCEKLQQAPSERQFFTLQMKFRKAEIIGPQGFPNFLSLMKAAAWKPTKRVEETFPEPKILVLDIELKPLLVYSWGIWDQKISPNQIKEDWSIISWAAKHIGDPTIFQMDLRGAKDHSKDKKILGPLWKLMSEADIVVTQNGISFDEKKINARFAYHGMPPLPPFKSFDTKRIAKRHFSFTSASLEYMNEHLGIRPKMKSKAFPGMELWIECLKNNEAAWDEMARYNTDDVLATEELYLRLRPWGAGGSIAPYKPSSAFLCQHCGSSDLTSQGTKTNRNGRYRQFKCKSCHGWTSETGQANNLMPAVKRLSLKGS